MSRKLLALAALALLVPTAALATGPGFKPIGWSWSGKTTAGDGVAFSTNLKESKINGLGTFVIRNEQCTINGQAQTLNVPARYTKGLAVRHGHFSGSSTGPTPFPMSIKVAGTLGGKKANGTLTWQMVPGGPASCTPNSGTISWSAKRGKKEYPGGG